MSFTAAAVFLDRLSFAPEDRLAIVMIHRATRRVVQRIQRKSSIFSRSFQAWLQEMNLKRQFDIYLSLNPLRPDAVGRTKRDIADIRHIFLDFDTQADTRVPELLHRRDIPRPSALVNSSWNHWQAIWRVADFSAPQAEALQRGLAREMGADIAATDCSRVLRYPGFLNWKYSPPWRVSAQHFGRGHESLTPASFPREAFLEEQQAVLVQDPARSRAAGVALSQSERDWAYAKRSLALGRPEEAVIAQIAANRTDKPNPLYYARLTVRKAALAIVHDPRSQKYRGGRI